MTPFVSVVIPVYNRAAVLGEALRSVLAQSERDLEIVVVDDGSTDDPKAVADALGDPRIRFVRQDNRGGGAARNTGVREAQGRFIAFLDSDDAFLPDHLATMRRLLEGTTRTAGYARILVDRGDGRAILKPPRAIRAGEDMATYLLCDRGFVPTITTVVPADLAKATLYHEDLREAEIPTSCFVSRCRAAPSSWRRHPARCGATATIPAANRRAAAARGWRRGWRR